jgi:hypothetical protein
MKVSGFTFLRNGRKLAGPFVQRAHAVQSVGDDLRIGRDLELICS